MRRHFELNQSDTIFIYQGLLSEGRGINLYIDAFKALPNNFILILMGYGPLEKVIKELSKDYKNIFFHPAVKPTEIIDVTSSADFGLCLIENYCLSYYYSLPNKLFEYTSSGIPVVCSSFPEMSELVMGNKIGWAIDPTVDELIKLVNSKIFTQKKEVYDKQIYTFIKKNNWLNEQRQLISLYKYLSFKYDYK